MARSERRADAQREADAIEGVLYRASEIFRSGHGRDPSDLLSLGIDFVPHGNVLEVGSAGSPAFSGQNLLSYAGREVAVEGLLGGRAPDGLCSGRDGVCLTATGWIDDGPVAWRLDGRTRNANSVAAPPDLASPLPWAALGAVSLLVASVAFVSWILPPSGAGPKDYFALLHPGIPDPIRSLSVTLGGNSRVLGHIALTFQRTFFGISSFEVTETQTIAAAGSRITARLSEIKARLGERRPGAIEVWVSVLLMPSYSVETISRDERRVLERSFWERFRTMEHGSFQTAVLNWHALSLRWLATLKNHGTFVHVVDGPYWAPMPPTVDSIMEFDRAHLDAFRRRDPVAGESQPTEDFAYSLFVAPRSTFEILGILQPGGGGAPGFEWKVQ